MNGSGTENRGEAGGNGGAGQGGRPAGRRRRKIVIAAVAVFAVLGAMFAVHEMREHHRGYGWEHHHGHGWGHGRGHGHHFGHWWRGGAGSERWKERSLDRAARWLGRIDATPEQREAMNRILGQGLDRFAEAAGEHRALRREWMAELARPTLDRAALEGLRARHVALVDGRSRQLLDMVLEAGTVLTAEQRNLLLSRLERPRKRGWWRQRDERREDDDRG